MARQSPSTVLARKLAVAAAAHWTRVDPENPCKPDYDTAFKFVYAHSSPTGRKLVNWLIEAHERDLDMMEIGVGIDKALGEGVMDNHGECTYMSFKQAQKYGSPITISLVYHEEHDCFYIDVTDDSPGEWLIEQYDRFDEAVVNYYGRVREAVDCEGYYLPVVLGVDVDGQYANEDGGAL